MIIPHADLAFALHATVAIVRAVALKRAVHEAKPDRKANFWNVIQGGLYDTAIVDWCVLFGSDNAGHQPLHWKNMFVEDDFRQGLLDALGMSLDQWQEYRSGIKAYRDENAAHRDLNPQTETYPNMDAALEATFFYNEQLRPKLEEIGAAEAKLSLRDEYAKCLREFGDMARTAVEATRS